MVLAAAVTVAAAGEASSVVKIRFDPPIDSLAPGEQRVIAVQVEGIPEAGLAVFQLQLRFEPGQIEVRDPNAGAGSGVPAYAPLGGSPLCAAIRQMPTCPDPEWMLTATGRQAIGRATLDSVKGTLTIAYGTVGEIDPQQGAGTLALIEVVKTGFERRPLRIVGAILADRSDPPKEYPFAITPGGRPKP